MKSILERAIEEARVFEQVGLSGIIIENTHDVPYTPGYAPAETIAAMAAICSAVRRMTDLPLGVQILAGAAIESLAVAVACNLQFLRVEGFAFAHVADEGLIQSCAAGLFRKRAELRATHIKVFADIKKKHASHAITADIDIAEMAKAIEFMDVDGVIVTGKRTGDPPEKSDLKRIKEATGLPLWIGSGMTEKNLESFLGLADCFIVGSTFKKDGDWKNPIDVNRINLFMKSYKESKNAKQESANPLQ